MVAERSGDHVRRRATAAGRRDAAAPRAGCTACRTPTAASGCSSRPTRDRGRDTIAAGAGWSPTARRSRTRHSGGRLFLGPRRVSATPTRTCSRSGRSGSRGPTSSTPPTARSSAGSHHRRDIDDDPVQRQSHAAAQHLHDRAPRARTDRAAAAHRHRAARWSRRTAARSRSRRSATSGCLPLGGTPLRVTNDPAFDARSRRGRRTARGSRSSAIAAARWICGSTTCRTERATRR